MARNKPVRVKVTHPFLTFLVVILVLLVIAMIVGFMWKLTDGFTDWSWFSSDEEVCDVDEVEDEGYEEFPDDPDLYSIRDDPEAPWASEDMYEAYVVDFSEEFSPEDFVSFGDVMSDDLLNE